MFAALLACLHSDWKKAGCATLMAAVAEGIPSYIFVCIIPVDSIRLVFVKFGIFCVYTLLCRAKTTVVICIRAVLKIKGDKNCVNLLGVIENFQIRKRRTLHTTQSSIHLSVQMQMNYLHRNNQKKKLLSFFSSSFFHSKYYHISY